MALSEGHQKWLEARGIPIDVATAYGLETIVTNHAGVLRHGIQIPYVSGGKILTKKIRWIDCGEPKWTHSEGGRHFWNEDTLEHLASDQALLITEGEWDALVAIAAGHMRTISVPCGAEGHVDLNGQLSEILRRCRKIILAGDADGPGQKMNGELARRFGPARCHRIVYPHGCKDLNDILVQQGLNAVKAALHYTQPYPIKGLYQLSDYPEMERPETYSTGWKCLDGHLKLWPGEFCVITGPPSHGKSRFALELLGALNRQYQHRAVIASFESPIVPYVRDIYREHYTDKRSHEVSALDKARADVWLESWASFIDQDPREEAEEANLDWIIQRAEDSVFRHGSNWLLLDPWNQIEHRRGKFESEHDYQARAIRALRRFARSYTCGVMVVAHPTKAIVERDGSLRKPSLYDVSGSAHWANAADHGVLIWRPSLISQAMEVHCLKSRYRWAGLPGFARLLLRSGRLEAENTGPQYSMFNQGPD